MDPIKHNRYMNRGFTKQGDNNETQILSGQYTRLPGIISSGRAIETS